MFWYRSKRADLYKERDELEDLFTTVGLDCVNQCANIRRAWDTVTFSYRNLNEAARRQSKRAIEEAREMLNRPQKPNGSHNRPLTN